MKEGVGLSYNLKSFLSWWQNLSLFCICLLGANISYLGSAWGWFLPLWGWFEMMFYVCQDCLRSLTSSSDYKKYKCSS